MRFYVFGGGNYRIDLASNSTARNAEDLVKITRHDISMDFGVGVEFYFPYFIFSPEVRFSHGLINIHSPDPKLQFSEILKNLFSRMIIVTIQFEG
jgi:hypothetical protein